MIVVKHYKTDLLLWNTDKTTCTLENTTENEPLCSVQHYRLVLEYGRVGDGWGVELIPKTMMKVNWMGSSFG